MLKLIYQSTKIITYFLKVKDDKYLRINPKIVYILYEYLQEYLSIY